MTTKLRGVDYGPVWAASGAMGFFGDGYWFHRPLVSLGLLRMKGITFVAKTATLNPRQGNMPLTEQFTLKERVPKSIKVRFMRGSMLNAVGLSNPGLEALLQTGKWQRWHEPFVLSVMCVGADPTERAEEMQGIATLLEKHLPFRVPVAVQVNVSCPNTGHDPKAMTIGEIKQLLRLLSGLNIPLIPKFSVASASIADIVELQDDPDCDAICVSNTLPFGWDEADWERAWGSQESPLAQFGGGGLSGVYLAPLVCKFIRDLRAAGFTKPINDGGGIMRPLDIDHFGNAGADSFFIGSAVTLRPWRVASIIERAHEWIGEG